MVTGLLVLAATLGVGKIPIHPVVAKFPDASRYSGSEQLQIAGLLRAIGEDAGTDMRTSGPGPQQMAARWRKGKLSADERVAILLTGGSFHDPVLLAAYRDGVLSNDQRERQAAGVGFGWLVGDSPLWMRPEDDKPENRAALARMIDDLILATRERTLLAIWSDSYLAAIGAPVGRVFVFSRPADRCLGAIRELATPQDLADIVALWPQASELRHRSHLRHTIEMITFRSFEPPPSGESRVTSGGWKTRAIVDAVDAWVNSLCGSQRGDLVATLPPDAGSADTPALAGPAGPWIRIVNLDIPAFWPVAVEKLSGFGAPAIHLNRSSFDDPRNREEIRRVRRYFPISAAVFKHEVEELMRPKPGAPNRGPRRPPMKKEVGGEESPGTP